MEEKEVICNDGTTDVSDGINTPCESHGGVKLQEGIDLVQGLSDGQKWFLFFGITALAWYITYKIVKQKV